MKVFTIPGITNSPMLVAKTHQQIMELQYLIPIESAASYDLLEWLVNAPRITSACKQKKKEKKRKR